MSAVLKVKYIILRTLRNLRPLPAVVEVYSRIHKEYLSLILLLGTLSYSITLINSSQIYYGLLSTPLSTSSSFSSYHPH
jgi:hypothetical protein